MLEAARWAYRDEIMAAYGDDEPWGWSEFEAGGAAWLERPSDAARGRLTASAEAGAKNASQSG